MKYNDLLDAVRSAAGLRLRLRLQPLYGEGEIVFPPTYAVGGYLISKRRIPGYEEPADCAILDSVQSQANRMEDALLSDIRAKKIFLPHVQTDFTKIDALPKKIGVLTCFECPHRIFDAILRDSVDEKGKHFPFTDQGTAIVFANARNATPIFAVSPASLLFGSWDSTGVSGGLGEKYTRCVVSEVVGVGAIEASRAGTRVDPLNMAKAVNPFKDIKGGLSDAVWKELKKKKKKAIDKPSEINHGHIIWPDQKKQKGPDHGGVTVDYIQQSTTISFPALRQLHFQAGDKDASAEAHAVLAAIALHAAALNVERGWHLRSRCDLILDDEQQAEWELLGSGSASKEPLTAETTRSLLKDSIAAAKAAGLPWSKEPVKLTPSKALEELVVKSQQSHRQSPTEE